MQLGNSRNILILAASLDRYVNLLLKNLVKDGIMRKLHFFHLKKPILLI